MTGRNLDSNFAAAMQASNVDGFVFVEMRLDSAYLYVAGLAHSFDYGGHTYLPVLGLGGIAQILETSTEVQGLSFSLSGVPASSIALALSEPVQGRLVIVRQACIVNGTVYVDDCAWQGFLDTMSLDDSGPKAVITVTAEHVLAAWAEPAQLLYSHEDQQQISPGDMFFQYASQMSSATIVWPNKEFFKQS
jgi:hypothetical protein